MNYYEAKEFQKYIIDKSFEIVEFISSIISEKNFQLAWEYIESNSEFKTLLSKLQPQYYEDIKIKSFDCGYPEFNKNLEEYLNEIVIRSISIIVPYKGENYGIDIKSNKLIEDINGNYRFDARFNILGKLSSTFLYEDDSYDLRYFPICLSKNPFNIYFLNDEEGMVSTQEYMDLHNFDFPLDYNAWTDNEYMQQRLSI